MDRRWRRWAAERPLPADATLAAGALLVELVIAAAVRPDENTFLVAAFSVLGAVPIALRRVAPWWALGVTLASLASVVVVHRSPFTSVLSFVVLTYTVASRTSLRTALAVACALWLPVLVIGVVPGRDAAAEPGRSPGLLILNNALLAAVAFFVGRAVNNRRASTRALEERARTAEANQQALAAQAVADERRRIARELHDVVAHHVSVMGVLATGARRVLRRDPDAADEALATIEEHQPDDAAGDAPAARRPAHRGGAGGRPLAAARPRRHRGAGRAGPGGGPAGTPGRAGRRRRRSTRAWR